VDHFQRAGRVQADIRVDTQIIQRQQQQQRSEPLARCQGALAQGQADLVQLRLGIWQAQRQALIDLPAQAQQAVALRERDGGILRLHGGALAGAPV